MVVLLLGFGVMVNPGLFLVDKSSAVTIRDEWVVEDKDSKSATSQNIGNDNTSDNTTRNNITSNEVDGTPAGEFDDIEESVSQDISEDVASESDIMPLAELPAGITFSIGGADKDATIEATPGVVAYREHTVTVNLTNADEYAMFISGNSDIVLDTNNAAKLVGMTNATIGTNIPAGQWGYGWDYTGSKSKEEMTYQAVPSTQTEILTPNIDAATNTVSFTGKLNFAGKFPEGAAVGNYTGGTATLALVVSPKGTTAGALWKKADGSDSNYYSGIHTMQEIDTVTRDGGFCKNNPIIQTGWTIELQDNRGPNPVEKYKIVKLEDGNCWMQQNLRLGGTSAMNLTPSDTNIKSNWTLPAAVTSWNTSNYAVAQTRIGSTSLSSSWQTSWGNYYSWCAATAGTCSESTADNVNVSGSICPKGWHLPSGGNSSNTGTNTGQNSELYKLFGADGANLGSNWQTRFNTIIASPYLFPAAGNYNGSLRNAGANGYYWSRTSSASSNAYILYFVSGSFAPGASSLSRYVGFSVRCVADY